MKNSQSRERKNVLFLAVENRELALSSDAIINNVAARWTLERCAGGGRYVRVKAARCPRSTLAPHLSLTSPTPSRARGYSTPPDLPRTRPSMRSRTPHNSWDVITHWLGHPCVQLLIGFLFRNNYWSNQWTLIVPCLFLFNWSVIENYTILKLYTYCVQHKRTTYLILSQLINWDGRSNYKFYKRYKWCYCKLLTNSTYSIHLQIINLFIIISLLYLKFIIYLLKDRR